MIKGLKKTESIISAIKKVLNSKEVQEMFDQEFSKMDNKVKNDFILVMLYKLCEGNKELMDIVSKEMFEELRMDAELV